MPAATLPPHAPRTTRASASRTRIYRLLAWGVTLLIVTLCVTPAPTPPGPEGVPLDKLGHLAAFALAAFLWHRSGLGTRGTWCLCAALAIGTEAVQGLLLPERSAEWADLAADLAGTLLGVLLATRLVGALRRAVARALYGRQAQRALAEARADLEHMTLPAALAKREALQVAPKRRPLALRALASAIAQQQRREGDRAPCLPRTLALVGEARRFGFAPRFVLGVKAPSEAFGAHAWLEVEGRPFLEEGTDLGRFAPMPDLASGAIATHGPAPQR